MQTRLHLPAVHHRTVSVRRHSCTAPRQQFACRSLCPYETLGIPATANDSEVKKAFRKLALQYHPDVCQSKDAHTTFIAIQQAYDILSGKARGKDIPTSKADWEWHEWYWNFCRSRNWRRNAAGKAQADTTATYSASQSKENIRTQLAGLRHRAAIRAQKLTQQHTPSEDCAFTEQTPSVDRASTQETSSEDCGSTQLTSSEDYETSAREQAAHAAASCTASCTSGHSNDSSNSEVEFYSVAEGPADSAAESITDTDNQRDEMPRYKKVVPGIDTNSRIMQQLAGLKRKAAYAGDM